MYMCTRTDLKVTQMPTIVFVLMHVLYMLRMCYCCCTCCACVIACVHMCYCTCCTCVSACCRTWKRAWLAWRRPTLYARALFLPLFKECNTHTLYFPGQIIIHRAVDTERTLFLPHHQEKLPQTFARLPSKKMPCLHHYPFGFPSSLMHVALYIYSRRMVRAKESSQTMSTCSLTLQIFDSYSVRLGEF